MPNYVARVTAGFVPRSEARVPNLPLTLAELFLDSLQFADVSYSHHNVVLTVWSLNHPPAYDYRDSLAVFTWKVELAAVPAEVCPQLLLIADNMGDVPREGKLRPECTAPAICRGRTAIIVPTLHWQK